MPAERLPKPSPRRKLEWRGGTQAHDYVIPFLFGAVEQLPSHERKFTKWTVRSRDEGARVDRWGSAGHAIASPRRLRRTRLTNAAMSPVSPKYGNPCGDTPGTSFGVGVSTPSRCAAARHRAKSSRRRFTSAAWSTREMSSRLVRWMARCAGSSHSSVGRSSTGGLPCKRRSERTACRPRPINDTGDSRSSRCAVCRSLNPRGRA